MAEILVVLAILAMLAGIVVPLFSSAPEQARLERARTEVQAIGEAVRRFRASTGDWPTLDATGGRHSLKLLLSGSSLPSDDPFSGGGVWWSWISTGKADLLVNHLLHNRPQGQSANVYPTGGTNGWRGPYTEAIPLDPWGRPYLVNVVVAWSTSQDEDRRMWVLSAGPDGVLQTSTDAGVSDAILGDDVGFLVYQR